VEARNDGQPGCVLTSPRSYDGWHTAERLDPHTFHDAGRIAVLRIDGNLYRLDRREREGDRWLFHLAPLETTDLLHHLVEYPADALALIEADRQKQLAAKAWRTRLRVLLWPVAGTLPRVWREAAGRRLGIDFAGSDECSIYAVGALSLIGVILHWIVLPVTSFRTGWDGYGSPVALIVMVTFLDALWRAALKIVEPTGDEYGFMPLELALHAWDRWSDRHQG